MAVAVGFPMGIISLAKLVLLVASVAWLFSLGAQAGTVTRTAWAPWTCKAIGLALGLLGLSLLWTTAPLGEAVHAWTKHAKLAMVPLLLLLIQTRAEALTVLRWFLGMQGFVLACSWLQVFHVPMPFPTQATPGRDYLVFAGHLDQPIMTGLATALFWHLRESLGLAGRRGLAMAVAVVLLAMLNILVIQFGRTGHLVAIALVAAAVFWSIPARFKLVAALSPVLVAGAIAAGSSQVQHRMALVWQETTNYTASGDIASSSGERLNYWRRSIQAFVERPVAGYGVGSWNMQYNRMEGGKGRLHTWQIRNPHQEFLLWMVEAGLVGLALLSAVLVAVGRDAARMHPKARHAVLSVLVATVVSCLFNASLFDAQIGDYLCLTLGITMAWGLRADRAESRAAQVAA